MEGWKQFEFGQKSEINLKDSDSLLIVKTLGKELPHSFLKKPSAKKTKFIMNSLSRLGKKLRFKSMSHGISKKLKKEGFRRTEWLYDLHWYAEKKNKKYQMTNLPLVVECEWDWIREAERKKELKKKKPKIDKYGAIKWDFQKLLVANATLRVMIFKLRAEKWKRLNDKLAEYFIETINDYENLPSGSKFLFVAFNRNGFRYKFVS